MIVAFWNRLKSADASVQAEWLASEGCGKGCPRWDVLVLSEVTERAAGVFAEQLGAPGHVHSWVEHGGSGTRPHGTMVISRESNLPALSFPTQAPDPANYLDGELSDLLASSGHPEAVRPRDLLAERWISVDLAIHEGPVAVAGFQAPYAAGEHIWDSAQNRLTKREAYQQLTSWAIDQQASGRSVIIGMDGNNWHDWKDPNEVRAETPRARRSRAWELLDNANLFDAERAFHAPDPPHRLIDSLRVAAEAGRSHDWHGSRVLAEQFGGPFGVTHLLKKDGPRMDRIYVSPDLEVARAGICHGHLDAREVAKLEKGDKLCVDSDHALVWAEVAG